MTKSQPTPTACRKPVCWARRVTTWMLVIAAVLAGAYLLDRWRAASAQDVVPWVESLATGRTLAQEQDMPMLLNYTSAWCGYCTQMKVDVFSKPQVADQIAAAFVPVKQDTQALSDAEHAVAARLQITGIPAYVVMAPDGRVVAQRAGYMPRDTFTAWLDDARARWQAEQDAALPPRGEG